MSEPVPGISSEQLDYLLRRYTPAEDQKCVVCGAPLQFSSSNARGSVYNCSSDDATRWGKVPLSERLDHYGASTWYDRGQADRVVVALVEAYRELGGTAGIPYDEPLEPFPSAAPDNTGDGDRWEDPRDTAGGQA